MAEDDETCISFGSLSINFIDRGRRDYVVAERKTKDRNSIGILSLSVLQILIKIVYRVNCRTFFL